MRRGPLLRTKPPLCAKRPPGRGNESDRDPSCPPANEAARLLPEAGRCTPASRQVRISLEVKHDFCVDTLEFIECRDTCALRARGPAAPPPARGVVLALCAGPRGF